MTDPRPGFQRDANAVVDAFKVGLNFDPPAISVTEFRAAMRMVGMPLDEDDTLETPEFHIPTADDEHEPVVPPEEEQ